MNKKTVWREDVVLVAFFEEEGGDILKSPIYKMEYKLLFVNKQKLIFYYNTSSLNPNMNQHALNEREK